MITIHFTIPATSTPEEVAEASRCEECGLGGLAHRLPDEDRWQMTVHHMPGCEALEAAQKSLGLTPEPSGVPDPAELERRALVLLAVALDPATTGPSLEAIQRDLLANVDGAANRAVALLAVVSLLLARHSDLLLTVADGDLSRAFMDLSRDMDVARDDFSVLDYDEDDEDPDFRAWRNEL